MKVGTESHAERQRQTDAVLNDRESKACGSSVSERPGLQARGAKVRFLSRVRRVIKGKGLTLVRDTATALRQSETDEKLARIHRAASHRSCSLITLGCCGTRVPSAGVELGKQGEKEGRGGS